MGVLWLSALCLAPLARLAWKAYDGRLGANPIEVITHTTGDWALNLLLATLVVSPLARLTRDGRWLKLRRALGLYCFLYACLHFSTWLALDKGLDVKDMLDDVAKRRFITAGFASLCLLLPLALTSTDGWIRRLGSRWGRLHRLVYPAAVLGVVHYLWLVKADRSWPLSYLAALAALLAFRVIKYLHANAKSRTGQGP